MMKLKSLVVVLMVGLMSCITTTFAADQPWTPIPGKQYDYDKKGAPRAIFHVELRAVFDSPEVNRTYDEYLRLHPNYEPVAYAWEVSRRTREKTPGYVFANCGLKADIRIEGVRFDEATRKGDFALTDQDRKMVHAIKASASGPDWIEFSGVDLGNGAANIILPFSFGPKEKMRMVIHPVNWVGVGRFTRNGKYDMPFGHRLNNQGFVPEMRVLPDSVKGRCRVA